MWGCDKCGEPTVVALAVAAVWHVQASEVAIAGLNCGGEELWWPIWHVAAAITGPGVLVCSMGCVLSTLHKSSGSVATV